MHIALSDFLTCPRCGPEFGLVLLAERIENRRVLDGWYGCANCRERYPVVGGFCDLRVRAGAREGGGAVVAPEPVGEDAIRLAALIGVTEGPAFVLVQGPAARFARALSQVVPKLEVVNLDGQLAGWPEEEGVCRLVGERRLPLFSRSLRSVVLTGEWADGGLEEGARVVAPLGRLVVEDAPLDAEMRIVRAGLVVTLQEGGTVVAVRK
jgi:uncharacterized protein YbaR (Trm112 family)